MTAPGTEAQEANERAGRSSGPLLWAEEDSSYTLRSGGVPGRFISRGNRP